MAESARFHDSNSGCLSTWKRSLAKRWATFDRDVKEAALLELDQAGQVSHGELVGELQLSLARGKDRPAVLITAYKPDARIWRDDWKTRKS